MPSGTTSNVMYQQSSSHSYCPLQTAKLPALVFSSPAQNNLVN